ncbi:MAG TPA: inorganic diphosphatase [Spirochaetales bacterium]|nr:inorganic diphosphatase [Spirochaetales bacterium]
MKVFIEGEAGSRMRYRFDERTLAPAGSRELRAERPYAYGFVPGTATETDDALDVWVVPGTGLAHGAFAECRILDVFMFREGDELEAKLLATDAPDRREVTGDERRRIEAYLVEVFKEWPEIRVSAGPLEGRERALALLRERGIDG